MEDSVEGRFCFYRCEGPVELPHLLLAGPGNLDVGIRLFMDYVPLDHLIRN